MEEPIPLLSDSPAAKNEEEQKKDKEGGAEAKEESLAPGVHQKDVSRFVSENHRNGIGVIDAFTENGAKESNKETAIYVALQRMCVMRNEEIEKKEDMKKRMEDAEDSCASMQKAMVEKFMTVFAPAEIGGFQAIMSEDRWDESEKLRNLMMRIAAAKDRQEAAAASFEAAKAQYFTVTASLEATKSEYATAGKVAEELQSELSDACHKHEIAIQEVEKERQIIYREGQRIRGFQHFYGSILNSLLHAPTHKQQPTAIVDFNFKTSEEMISGSCGKGSCESYLHKDEKFCLMERSINCASTAHSLSEVSSFEDTDSNKVDVSASESHKQSDDEVESLENAAEPKNTIENSITFVCESKKERAAKKHKAATAENPIMSAAIDTPSSTALSSLFPYYAQGYSASGSNKDNEIENLNCCKVKIKLLRSAENSDQVVVCWPNSVSKNNGADSNDLFSTYFHTSSPHWVPRLCLPAEFEKRFLENEDLRSYITNRTAVHKQVNTAHVEPQAV